MNLRFLLLALLLASAPVMAAEAPATPWDTLLNALRPYRQVDTQHVARAAVEAALHALDPHALLIPHSLPVEAPPTNRALLDQADLWPEQIVRLEVRGLYALDAEGVDVVRRWLLPTPAGLVLDLRGADGDDLDTLDALGGLFFTNGTPIYSLRDGQDVVLTTRVARAEHPAPDLPPTVVLLDGDTRGASEALAAILRDHAGLMLIGTHTHGDSARRERISYSADEDLMIATRWIVPASGLDYDPAGVAPHIVVLPTPAPAAATSVVATATNTMASVVAPTNAPADAAAEPVVPDLSARIGNDIVLRRAVDILLGLQALRKP